MADIISTIINGSPIRNGGSVVKADKFGDRDSLQSPNPNGSNALESRLTNRLGQNPSCSIYNTKVTVPASGTETSWCVPEGVNKVLCKARTLDDISMGFSSGAASGVDRTTIFSGTAWESPDQIDFKSTQYLYFTGPSGTVVEIQYWL